MCIVVPFYESMKEVIGPERFKIINPCDFQINGQKERKPISVDAGKNNFWPFFLVVGTGSATMCLTFDVPASDKIQRSFLIFKNLPAN